MFQYLQTVLVKILIMLWCMLQLASGHRAVILSAMEKIIKQKIDEIDNDLVQDTIKQSSAELTMSKVKVLLL